MVANSNAAKPLCITADHKGSKYITFTIPMLNCIITNNKANIAHKRNGLVFSLKIINKDNIVM